MVEALRCITDLGFPHSEGEQRRLVVASRVVQRVHGGCCGGCRVDGVRVQRRS